MQRNAAVVLLVFFLYKTGEALLEPSVKLYLYEKTCIEQLSNDPLICRHLNVNSELERLAQRTASSYIMWYRVLLNVPAILLSLLIGAWSDRFGRKLPMMLPCIGSMTCVFLYLFSMIDGAPTFPLVLIGATINGISGKSTLITMACHSYITDISTAEGRTNLLGKLLSMNFLGIFLGSFLIGVLLNSSDYIGTFLVVILINGLALLVVKLALPETVTVEESNGRDWNLCRCQHVNNSLAVALRPRTAWKRTYLWFLFVSIFVHQACKVGEVDITMLFVKRAPLVWSTSQYGYYLSFDYAVLGFTLFFVLPFFTDVLQMSDVNLLLLSILTKIARLVFLAASSETWLVYVSSLIGCTGGILVSASKSLITKIIDENEVGKMFSLLSCAETASNMIGAIAFTHLYQSTADVFAGSAFIVDAAVYGMLLGATMLYRRHAAQQQRLEAHLASAQAPNPFRGMAVQLDGDDYETSSQSQSELDPLGAASLAMTPNGHDDLSPAPAPAPGPNPFRDSPAEGQLNY